MHVNKDDGDATIDDVEDQSAILAVQWLQGKGKRSVTNRNVVGG